MHRRPKPSLILGVVAALAVTSPVVVYAVGDSTSGVRAANDETAVVPTQIAKLALANAPDIVIPLKELTGLDLPDIDLGSLRDLSLPDSFEIPAIPGLTVPEVPAAAPTPPPAPVDPADAGAVVKEVSQETPFSMVALTADQLGSAVARVRAQLDDGSWGPWNETQPIDTGRTDSDVPTVSAGTEPIFVGMTKRVQFLLTPTVPAGAALNPADPAFPVDPAPAPLPDAADPVAPAAPVAQDLGYVPASSSRPLRAEPIADTLAAATAVLITPGTSAADSTLSDIASPVEGSGPSVITRAQWGADESKRCGSPTYDDSLGGATVHHTAGSNNYTKDESAGIVRAIYAYHAQTLGWCDIGYNVLVDKYGQVFEGRAGGLDRNVEGAHAGGFNENTVGLALMGDYSTEQPTQESLDAAGKFLGWRLGKAGLDPQGQTTMTSEGTQYTFVQQGKSIDLPVIFAHRDVGNTECPGDAAYGRMDEIRSIAAANLNGTSAPTTPATPDTTTPDGATPGTDGLVAPPSVDAASPAPGTTLTGLVSELLAMGVQNPIVQKWVAEGGESGRLGAALTGLLAAPEGQTRADFTNGSIYTTPSGQVVSVLGQIFKQFVAMGSESGSLGLPTSDEYRIPNGWQSDFENGSLSFDEVTGIVTTVVKTFTDTYTAEMNAGAPADGLVAPVPEAAPAPEPAPVG
ncbi:cold-shock protein [Rhodococcus sp. Leaf7]|uniref:N-acetylmuramoyl-L-alanine amidase n=1 Tax=unclassified Rhodococcus (in: high G+C Gram-positive bacteria) TaxID=192944 RepID=UPI0005ABBC6C|nr:MULTISPECIES: N-acetylmuramoyl-L-alanine amidase [unclassified Rhodococcus (in: high G+C Gram-positive bacteria)]KIQ17040.1 cold-shock protein [Rhodococcus sp. MEB064]KQU07655.1 cold-shock protein [Rhodococcus sp. Leaf7]KQU43175.1 cold-shock protein [Rhodococcus sp. Leaf247]